MRYIIKKRPTDGKFYVAKCVTEHPSSVMAYLNKSGEWVDKDKTNSMIRKNPKNSNKFYFSSENAAYYLLQKVDSSLKRIFNTAYGRLYGPG
jgi:hypothetical protein